MKSFGWSLLTGLLLLPAPALPSAIPVNLVGAPFTFDSLPLTNEWTTLHVPFNSPNISNFFGLNQLVQSFAASNITNPLTTATLYPSGGSGANAAFWSSPAQLLETRPTGNSKALLLMARLENRTAMTLSTLHLSYLMGMPVTNYTGGELSGYWVYFSTNGASNTWQFVPELSGYEVTHARVQAVLQVGAWLPGSEMFVLWADDNADNITDRSYTIDDLTVEPLRLTIAPLNATTVQVSWSTAAVDFDLWSATAPRPAEWQMVTLPRAVVDGFYQVTLPIDGQHFFRLQKGSPP